MIKKTDSQLGGQTMKQQQQQQIKKNKIHFSLVKKNT